MPFPSLPTPIYFSSNNHQTSSHKSNLHSPSSLTGGTVWSMLFKCVTIQWDMEVDQGGKWLVSKLWLGEKIRLRNKYDRKFVTNPCWPVPMDPGGWSGNQVHTECKCPISKKDWVKIIIMLPLTWKTSDRVGWVCLPEIWQNRPSAHNNTALNGHSAFDNATQQVLSILQNRYNFKIQRTDKSIEQIHETTKVGSVQNLSWYLWCAV